MKKDSLAKLKALSDKSPNARMYKAPYYTSISDEELAVRSGPLGSYPKQSSLNLRRDVLKKATKTLQKGSELLRQTASSSRASTSERRLVAPASTQPASISLVSKPRARVSLSATQPTKRRESPKSITLIDLSSDEEGRPISKPLNSSVQGSKQPSGSNRQNYDGGKQRSTGDRDDPFIIDDSESDEASSAQLTAIQMRPKASYKRRDIPQTVPLASGPATYSKTRESVVASISETSGDDAESRSKVKEKHAVGLDHPVAEDDSDARGDPITNSDGGFGCLERRLGSMDTDFSSMEVDTASPIDSVDEIVAAVEAGVGEVQLDDEPDDQIAVSNTLTATPADSNAQDDAEVDGLLGLATSQSHDYESRYSQEPSTKGPEVPLEGPEVLLQEKTAGDVEHGERSASSQVSGELTTSAPISRSTAADDDHSIQADAVGGRRETEDDLASRVAQDDSQIIPSDSRQNQVTTDKITRLKVANTYRASNSPPVHGMFGFFNGSASPGVQRNRSSQAESSNTTKTTVETPLRAIQSRLTSPEASAKQLLDLRRASLEPLASQLDEFNSSNSKTRPVQKIEIPEPIPIRKLHAARPLRDALKAERKGSDYIRSATPERLPSPLSPKSLPPSEKAESTLGSPSDPPNNRAKDVIRAKQEGQRLLSMLGLSAESRLPDEDGMFSSNSG